MFSYYGCKNRLSKFYPAPTHDLIIEPFAGAAFYSCIHGLGKYVLLVDKYKVICDIWNYLIHATPEMILALPEPKTGDKCRDFKVSDVEKQLLYFLSNSASAVPLNTAGKWNSFRPARKRILSSLDGIRNWRVENKSFSEIPNHEATWFIDPPYFAGGHRYKHSNRDINFEELGLWCRERKGQVIVCENTKATWLPFTPLVELHGQKHTTTEAVYIQ